MLSTSALRAEVGLLVNTQHWHAPYGGVLLGSVHWLLLNGHVLEDQECRRYLPGVRPPTATFPTSRWDPGAVPLPAAPRDLAAGGTLAASAGAHLVWKDRP
jgi:hypothetical protein